MTIQDLLDKVESLNLEEAIPQLIRDTDYSIEGYNEHQLLFGIKRDVKSPSDKGSIIGRYKNDSYASFKHMKNPDPGFGIPDLFLTGSFQKNMFVIPEGLGFEVDSFDSKTTELVAKYGQGIFGLTEENLKEYAHGAFFEAFRKYITNKTGLEFT